MPPDIIFPIIAGFRLVTADPAVLSTFYRAIGFDIGGAVAIPGAEMELLGLSGTGSRIAMSLGRSRVDLESFDHPGRPYPSHTAACDLVFQHLALVTDDAGSAWCRARDAGATLISAEGPVTLPRSAGGVIAIKFRDPEGHPLELIQFPPATRPEWTGTGILGIDHSAISVRDVSASQRFYTRHGLREVGATFNDGPTQDALDGLDGVRVDIVPMTPSTAPPHVELLGYRCPVGHAFDPVFVNDLAATRVVWRANANVLIRDPDGHLHQLTR